MSAHDSMSMLSEYGYMYKLNEHMYALSMSGCLTFHVVQQSRPFLLYVVNETHLIGVRPAYDIRRSRVGGVVLQLQGSLQSAVSVHQSSPNLWNRRGCETRFVAISV